MLGERSLDKKTDDKGEATQTRLLAPMPSSDSSDEAPGTSRIEDLPNEILLCILRQLLGVEVLAACAASATCARLVHSEQLWRRSCEHRWPEAFSPGWGQMPKAALEPPPFRMPEWHRPHVPLGVDAELQLCG